MGCEYQRETPLSLAKWINFVYCRCGLFFYTCFVPCSGQKCLGKRWRMFQRKMLANPDCHISKKKKRKKETHEFSKHYCDTLYFFKYWGTFHNIAPTKSHHRFTLQKKKRRLLASRAHCSFHWLRATLITCQPTAHAHMQGIVLCLCMRPCVCVCVGSRSAPQELACLSRNLCAFLVIAHHKLLFCHPWCTSMYWCCDGAALRLSVSLFFTAKDSFSTWINKLLSLLRWWFSVVIQSSGLLRSKHTAGGCHYRQLCYIIEYECI